jgi:hypothetical protein
VAVLFGCSVRRFFSCLVVGTAFEWKWQISVTAKFYGLMFPSFRFWLWHCRHFGILSVLESLINQTGCSDWVLVYHSRTLRTASFRTKVCQRLFELRRFPPWSYSTSHHLHEFSNMHVKLNYVSYKWANHIGKYLSSWILLNFDVTHPVPPGQTTSASKEFSYFIQTSF